MQERNASGGASPEAGITLEALRSYVAKSLADQELIRRIDQERSVAGSWVQRTIDGLYEKLVSPLNVDFGKVADVNESLDEDKS